jgi:alpha-1,2-mannosyltransferase
LSGIRSGISQAWLVLPAAAGGIALWLLSEPAQLFSDFYKAYYPTAEMLLQSGPRATWPSDELCVSGFANLPVVAWLFAPLVPLGQTGAGWLFFGLGVAATLAAWLLLTRSARPDSPCGWTLLSLFLVNGPLVNSLREGNITHIVLFFLVMALLLWRAGRDYAAGLVLGICAVLKLPLLLYGIYFLARRRWLVVAGGATTIGAMLLASLAVFGPDINIGWYEYCVEPFVGRAVPAFNVQSVDGFLIRLTTGDALLREWDPIELSAAHAVARLAILAILYGGAFYLLRRADRREPMPRVAGALSVRDLLEFVLVLTLALLTSPLAWTHYYLLLLAWGLYLGGRLPLTDDATTRWLVRGSIVLTSLPVIIVPIEEPSWWSSLAARTIVSAWFFGGLLLLSAVVRGIRLATQPGGSERAKEMGVEP